MLVRRKLLALVLASLLVSASVSETIDDFEGGYFKIISKQPALYNLDIGVKTYNDGAIPMAYADLNSDS